MRRMTTTAASAALALALAACGSGDGGPGPTAGDEYDNTSTPAAPSTSTSDSSTSSSTSSSESTSGSATETSEPTAATSTSATSTDTGTPFDPDEFTADLEAAIEENPTVHIDVSVTVDGRETITATGHQDLANDALDMEVDMNGQQLGYRLVDGEYYLAQPPKWVPVTEDSTNPVVKQALDQVQVMSMRTQLDGFVAGVEQVGDKGTEEIDGVTTRRYAATVDTGTVRDELGMEQDPNAPESMVYDVWLDEDDLIRKLSFTQEGSEATLTATDWGEPVDIEKPADSELADVG